MFIGGTLEDLVQHSRVDDLTRTPTQITFVHVFGSTDEVTLAGSGLGQQFNEAQF